MSKTVRFQPVVVGGKGTKRKVETRNGRKKSARRPDWNDTVTNLTVHKLSKEEADRRHRSVQSKNAEAARHELYEKAKDGLDVSGNLRHSPLPPGGANKLTALQRALHGKELHDVLAESDKALAVVKDLFGDDPKEDSREESQSDGPGPTAAASPGGIRDDSIQEMVPRKPALNDPPPELSLQDTDDTLTLDPSTPCYQPTVDLKRFQRLIEQEEPPKPVTSDTGTSAESLPHPSTEVGRTGTLEIHERGVQTVGREDWGRGGTTKVDETEMSELSSISQDTVVDGLVANYTIDSESSSLYVTRPQPSVPKQTHGDETTGGAARTDPQMSAAARLPPPPTHPLYVAQKMPLPIPAIPGSQGGESWKSGKAGVGETTPRRTLNTNASLQESSQKGRPHDDLEVLEQLVQQLEAELEDYEKSTGYHCPVKRPTLSQAGTFSGLTASLLASVTKLTHYLKQSESQLRGEVAVRGQLLHAMTEQQNLMDALTTDMVKVQEENGALQNEVQELKQTNSEELKRMQEEISELRKKMSSLVLSQNIPPPPPPALPYQLPPAAIATTAASTRDVPSTSASSVSSGVTSVPNTAVPSATIPSAPDLSISQSMDVMDASREELRASPKAVQPRLHEPSPFLHPTLPPHTHPTLPHPTLPPHPPPTLPPHPHPTLYYPAPSLTTTLAPYSPAIPHDSPGVIYAQVSPLSYADYGHMLPPPTEHSSSLFSDPGVSVSGLSRLIHSAPSVETSRVTPLHVASTTSAPSSLNTVLHQPNARPFPIPHDDSKTATTLLYAPSPPPLNVALQVPSFSTTGTTLSKPGITTNAYHHYSSNFANPPRPQFDTAELLSRLGISLPQSGSTSAVTSQHQATTSKPAGLPTADLSLLPSASGMDTLTASDCPNFLDMETSMQQMSTLAKSVLQDIEREQQQQQLQPKQQQQQQIQQQQQQQIQQHQQHQQIQQQQQQQRQQIQQQQQRQQQHHQQHQQRQQLQTNAPLQHLPSACAPPLNVRVPATSAVTTMPGASPLNVRVPATSAVSSMPGASPLNVRVPATSAVTSMPGASSILLPEHTMSKSGQIEGSKVTPASTKVGWFTLSSHLS